jgi:hypothetical protein
VKSQRVAAFGRPRPPRFLAGEGDLLSTKACLIAERGTGAALALQAVAHGNPGWLALDGQVKLPATASGAAVGHGLPRLSI